MLNKSGFTKTTAVAPTQILANVELQHSMGVVVAQGSTKAGADGRKILKAGTPLAGNLDTRTTPFTQATGADAVGVLLHDVDVTAGNANGTLLIFGFVNTNRIDGETKALVTSEVKTALKGNVTFVAC